MFMVCICFVLNLPVGCDKYGPCEQYFSAAEIGVLTTKSCSNLSLWKYEVMVASVIFRCWSSRTGVFLALWLCVTVSAQAQNKLIRLRNEQIHTAPES